MTTPSKKECHFEQLLSEIYARRPHENNQKVCIDSTYLYIYVSMYRKVCIYSMPQTKIK